MANNRPSYVYKTIAETRVVAENWDPVLDDSKKRYVNFFAVIKAELYFNIERGLRTYEITDDTNSCATLSLKIGPKAYPELKVGNVIRVHCCKVHIYNGKLECNLSVPERIVVYSKTANGDINRVTVADNPSFHPTDNDKVRALFEVDLFPEEPGEEFTFSKVLANGMETDVIAQLIGYHVLNDGTTNNSKRAFVFFWDGTKCSVRDLKKHKPFKFDNPNNPKRMDDQLAFRAKGYAHDFFIFDNMAANIVNFKPGDIVLLEGVVIKYGKEKNYLTVKETIRKVQETDRNARRLMERLARVPRPRESIDSLGEEEILMALLEPEAVEDGNGNQVAKEPDSSTSARQKEPNDSRVAEKAHSSTSSNQEEPNDRRVAEKPDSTTSSNQESTRNAETTHSSIPQAESTTKDRGIAVADFYGRNNAIENEQSNSEQNGHQSPSSSTLPQRSTEDIGDMSKQPVPKTSKRSCQVDDEGWIHFKLGPVTQSLRREQPVLVNTSEHRQERNLEATTAPARLIAFTDPYEHLARPSTSTAYVEPQQETTSQTETIPESSEQNLTEERNDLRHKEPSRLKRLKKSKEIRPLVPLVPLKADLRADAVVPLTVRRQKRAKVEEIELVDLTEDDDDEERPKKRGGAIKIQGKTRVFKHLPQSKLKTIEDYFAKLKKTNGESGESSYQTAQSSIESDLDSQESIRAVRGSPPSLPETQESQSQSQPQSMSMLTNVSRNYANYKRLVKK